MSFSHDLLGQNNRLSTPFDEPLIAYCSSGISQVA